MDQEQSSATMLDTLNGNMAEEEANDTESYCGSEISEDTNSIDEFVRVPMRQRSIFETETGHTKTVSSEKVPGSDFVWSDFPSDVPLPQERREIFIAESCGCTETFTEPYTAFTAIWSLDLIELIVNKTNCNIAKQNPGKLNTNIDEVYVLLAWLLQKGLLNKTFMGDSLVNRDLLKSHSRFIELIKYLCFNDKNPTNETVSNVKIHEIQPLIDHLNSKFQSLYYPKQDLVLYKPLTLEEEMHSFDNMYIIGKVQINMYDLFEADTCYLWKSNVSINWLEESVSLEAFNDQVTDLVKGLENQGHTIWFSNTNHNPMLARSLKSSHFDSVGSFNQHGRDVPQRISILSPRQNMEPGQFSGCTSGDVDLLVWKDCQTIKYRISTYHGPDVCDDEEENECPTVFFDYKSVCEEAVRRRKSYSYSWQEVKDVWYYKLFTHLLNCSVSNAYVLFKRSPLHENTKFDDFSKALIIQIVWKHLKKHAVLSDADNSLLKSLLVVYDNCNCNEKIGIGNEKSNESRDINSPNEPKISIRIGSEKVIKTYSAVKKIKIDMANKSGELKGVDNLNSSQKRTLDIKNLPGQPVKTFVVNASKKPKLQTEDDCLGSKAHNINLSKQIIINTGNKSVESKKVNNLSSTENLRMVLENEFDISNESKSTVQSTEHTLISVDETGNDESFEGFCIVCNKQVTAYCQACGVPLCIGDCHESFHGSNNET